METLTDRSIRLEHFVTPQWAIDAIMSKEVFTPRVVDPCCGSGIMSEAARKRGHGVMSFDVHDWGYRHTEIRSWLDRVNLAFFSDATCFMNPPFSLATEFVVKAVERGFRKIICFQRFAWYESIKRRAFWDKHPPNRVYICGDRASCWRFDIDDERRAGSTTPTAHAWFVWDRDTPPGTILGRIYKKDIT